MFTNDMIKELALELARVRKDNRTEGTDLFVATMTMLETDDRYNEDFNKVIELANTL